MRVVLISCVAKKLDFPSLARDMYVSPLFKGAYEYAKKLGADKIFILSAKYGLLAETDLIEPYNETLNGKPLKARKEWAAKVISSLSQQVDLQSDEFVFLAGEKYRRYLVERIANTSIPLKGFPIGKQLAFYKKNNLKTSDVNLCSENPSKISPFNDDTGNSRVQIASFDLIPERLSQLSILETVNLCEQLHLLVRMGKRFDFSMGYSDIPLNGIYIMFERGEFAHGGDRIVRIGTHTGDRQLKSRIFQHFENKNKNRSIFRKNIGRCFLNRDNDPYLSTWELDTTTKEKKELYSNIIDKEFEASVEKQISQYIQNNLSFCLLDVPSKEDRLYYEARLIGTVSNCIECSPSPSWLGAHSPVAKITKSGLWQVMELYSKELSVDELNFISSSLIRNIEG